MASLRTASFLAATLAFATTSCGANAGLEALPDQGHSPTKVVPELTLCPGTRIIGVLEQPPSSTTRACELDVELPAGWRAALLFEGGSPLVAALRAPAPGELSRYCSYEYQGEGAASVDAMLASLAAAPTIQRHSIGLDCTAGAGLGEPEPPDMSEVMSAAFRDSIGWVSGEALADSHAARTPIEVAIVDSLSTRAAHDPTIEPSHPHGPAMGALISDIACPDRAPSCLENVRYTLALPRAVGQTRADWLAGGGLGTASDVALGVYLAVARWRRRGAARHLVINLSVGWEMAAADAGPERALRAALEYASCQGALVFAAAGNGANLGCTPSSGPLTPASYETLPAPDARECRLLGFADAGADADADTNTSTATPSPMRPLVYAVAGVDASGQPLANARLGARPRLATAASNAAAPLPAGGYSVAMSGSSVAAAAASATAALLWSYQPQRSAAEIVEHLYASGTATNGSAAFGFDGPGAEVRRVSVCSALARACEGAPTVSCPSLSCVDLAEADRQAAARIREAIRARRAAAKRGATRVHRGSVHVSEQSCVDAQPSLAVPL